MSYPHTPPPPSGSLSDEERLWSVGAHIGTLAAAWFAMGIIAPLVVLVVKGNESHYIRRHAVESLNFQISLLIYLAIAAVAILFTLGLAILVLLPLIALAGLFALVAIIMATLAASRGDDFHYPLCIRLVK